MSPLTRLELRDGTEKRWQELLQACTVDTLFITPLWQRVWWEQFGDGAEMLLLSLQDGGNLEALAPLARHDGSIRFIGDQDVCDYNDFLVLRGAESRFYPSLLDHLEGETWQTLDLYSVPEGSPTLAYLPELARQRGYQVEVQEEDVAPGVRLPESWEAYLQTLTKKDRHELRRKLRRLESASEGFRYYSVSEPTEVEHSLDDLLSLMRSSREDKRDFLTPSREQFFRRLATEMARVGILKLFFLEMGGERMAATMCFDYGATRLLYNSGFNPAHGYYSVGLLLKALCLKDAIEEGKEYFDFLRGSEPYKYDLGARDRSLYQVVVRRS